MDELAEQRFWSKVDTSAGDEGCWEWLGRVSDPHRYGRFWVPAEGRAVPVHRVAYMLAVGEIDEGMFVGHRCRNSCCCNPAHLELLTPKQASENRSGASRANPSGLRGVYQVGRARWLAKVGHRGRAIYVGRFKSEAEAAEAVRAARRRLHTANYADRAVVA